MSEQENHPTSLNQFVRDNAQILSAMAVLIALTTFVSELSVKWLSNLLTCLSIAGLVTVWLEINSLTPKNPTKRLLVFRFILLLGLLGLIFYWFIAFRWFWNIFLFVPLFGLLMYMLSVFTKNLRQFGDIKFIGKIFGIGKQKNIFQRLFIWIVNGFIVVMCVYFVTISIPAAHGINKLVDMIMDGSFMRAVTENQAQVRN